MTNGIATVDAVRKSVTVECDIEHALRTFTEGIGGWWPLRTHSLSAGTSEVAETATIEPRAGGRVYERRADGVELDWGEVLAWEPPSRLVLQWRVNRTMPATQVEVRFSEEDGRTRVDLEHRGWERYPADAGPEARASYAGENGWSAVLGRYADAARP